MVEINIDAESVITQKVERELAAKEAEEKKKKFKEKVEFDSSHYLGDYLDKNQTTKTLRIRLLPFCVETGELSPFKEVHVHQVKVNENGEKKWKRYMCPVGMKTSDKCPFCEASAEAHKKKYECDDEALRKTYGDIEYANKMKDYYLVRCIDRDHEEDGVKFWRFAANKKGDGIYDKIYSIFQTRNLKGTNIFDLTNGKDLIVTVTRKMESGKSITSYQITDDDEKTPLSTNDDIANAWIYDKLTWQDVYPVKDYDYLFIAAQGDVPFYSKELGRWASKAEIDKVNNEIKTNEVASKVTPQPQDFSQYVINTGSTQTATFEQATVKVPISELPPMEMQAPKYVGGDASDDLPF
jgi:hypothetical protein